MPSVCRNAPAVGSLPAGELLGARRLPAVSPAVLLGACAWSEVDAGGAGPRRGRRRLDDSLLDPEEQHAGRDVGLLVHASWRGACAGGPPETAALLEEARGWQRQAGVHLSQVALERAVNLTRAFWSSPLAVGLSAPSSRREAPFFFAQAETVVSGIMDLVFSDEVAGT